MGPAWPGFSIVEASPGKAIKSLLKEHLLASPHKHTNDQWPIDTQVHILTARHANTQTHVYTHIYTHTHTHTQRRAMKWLLWIRQPLNKWVIYHWGALWWKVFSLSLSYHAAATHTGTRSRFCTQTRAPTRAHTHTCHGSENHLLTRGQRKV